MTNNGTLTLDGVTVNNNKNVTNKGTLTISGGTFSNTVGNTVSGATTTINGGTITKIVVSAEGSTVTINDGTFTDAVRSSSKGTAIIKGGLFVKKPVAERGGTVSIEGGKFKLNPIESNEGVTLADGKQMINVVGNDYPHQVIDKLDTDATVKVDQGETTVEAADTIDAEVRDAALNAAKSTTADLEDAAVEHVKRIVAASTSVNDNTKNIFIVPALKVKAEEYTVDGENSTMTLDIEATYTSYETDVSITDATQVKANVGDESKVKEIGSGKLDTIGKEIGVMIEVPTAFANALGAQPTNDKDRPITVFVKHTHENKNIEYRANLYSKEIVITSPTFSRSTKYFVEFSNPDGFSTFTISKTSSSVVEADVNGKTRY